MNLSRSTPEASPPMTAEPSPEPEGKARQVSPSVSPGPSLAQCAALIATVAFVQAGCASVQLRPEPEACPEEAVEAMQEFGLNPFRNGEKTWRAIFVDVTKQDDEFKLNVYANGPTTGVFDGDDQVPMDFREDSKPPLQEGHLWVSAPGDRVFGRFTRLRSADGTIIPICAELCDMPPTEPPFTLGVPKEGPGPRQDTVLMRQAQTSCFTEHWR